MKKRKDFLVFGSPLIEEEEINEVVKTMRSGWIGTGPKVHQFEEMFKQYKGADYAIALNSCTAALHLSLNTIGIQPGDEVLVPTMTFAATANAVIHSGGIPVFIDCERDTSNIDLKKIEERITSKTKAIIVVHFAGRPCEMDPIMEIAKRYNIKIIEDCAHSIEAQYKEKTTGLFGDIGCFSFYVTKNIVTGEGGMAVTNNPSFANKIKVLALHGMSKDAWNRFSDDGYKHYEIVYAGYKYNMMDIQAAMGIHQLPRIDKYYKRREKIWTQYNNAFKDLPVFLPAKIPSHIKHSYHLYTLLLDINQLKFSRDFFLMEMTKRNIGVGVHYIALHLQPFYQKIYNYKDGDFPNAEWISQRTVSLPLSPKMSEQDVGDVIAAVREICTSTNLKK